MARLNDVTANGLIINHIAGLLNRGPMARRLSKATSPIKIKVVNGRIGDWKVADVLDALSWMGGSISTIHHIDGFESKAAGYITVWPKGSLVAAA